MRVTVLIILALVLSSAARAQNEDTRDLPSPSPAGRASLSSNAAPAAQQGSANFDGLWSVVIVTSQGVCDRSYRYPARIVGSRVMQANADPSYRLYGAVSRSGAIRVIVARGGQWADGRGRLIDGRGTGIWTTSGGQCSGEWTASRRG
jgi:hypothetical protein